MRNVRKITREEYETLCEGLDYLAHVLNAMGVAEYRMSMHRKEIFWDTANGGQVNPELLQKFCSVIENFYLDELIK
jgi:hypothetical protein